jgi:hypothetical protein
MKVLLGVTAAALAVPFAASGAAFDPIPSVFSKAQIAMIGTDSRCGGAQKAAEALAESNGNDVRLDLDALKALEQCAALRRLDAEENRLYTDRVMTAAAASALLLGRAAGEPKAFARAIKDAKYVRGFNAQTSTLKTTEVRSTGSNVPISSDELPKTAVGEMGFGAGTVIRHDTVTSRVAGGEGSPGAYGRLASAIAASAESEMKEWGAKR